MYNSKLMPHKVNNQNIRKLKYQLHQIINLEQKYQQEKHTELHWQKLDNRIVTL